MCSILSPSHIESDTKEVNTSKNQQTTVASSISNGISCLNYHKGVYLNASFDISISYSDRSNQYRSELKISTTGALV